LESQAMLIVVNVAPHLFWVTSRAAGVTALVVSSVAVCVGLLMSTRLYKRVSGPDLRVLHEVLSLTTIAAIVVHAVALLGDGFLRPSFLDVSLPFVSSYKAVWTTLGIVAGWSLIVLGLSYYARRRIGQQRWRKLHRFTALAWLLGMAHSLGEGTDAGQLWFLAMLAIVAVPALVLLLGRFAGGQRGSEPAGARSTRPAAESAS
jgi:sulfoxide reductase heme-binding subunit YedZ